MQLKSSKLYRATALLVFSILFVYIIIIAKSFLAPIALSILFSYLLFPVTNFFEKKLKIPRIFSNLFGIILAGLLLFGVSSLIYFEFSKIIDDLPTIKSNISANLLSVLHFIEDNFGISMSIQKIYIKESVNNFVDSSGDSLGKVFSATGGTIVKIGLLPVYIFFMLFYRDKAFQFIIMASKTERKEKATRIINEISQITKKYMSGVFIVVSILCVLNSLGLKLIGMKYPIFFGILAAMCNFIPYFGTIIGFAIPAFSALLIMDTPNVAIAIIILMFIVNFIENNILTPNIVGGNVRLNPFIIILSLVIGALVWGIPGMLIIVPLIAVFRVVCENVQTLKPLAFLLGVEGAEKHAINVKNIKIFMRRFRRVNWQKHKLN